MSKMKWWNNGVKNKRCSQKPDDSFVEGRLKFKRKPHSDETKKKISTSNLGRTPWNKNKTGVYSEETIEKMSNSKKGFTPWNKGLKINYTWNSGLTYETDERVRKYVDKQKGQKRKGNYKQTNSWKGEKNPWFGKKRNSDLSPRYNPERHTREYWNFYNKVVWASEMTYLKYKDEINPNNYPRTLCGVEGGYQLDHKIPIDYGWKNKMTIEEMSCKENLQIISWQENRKKSNKIL
jgi:hypothetical protein